MIRKQHENTERGHSEVFRRSFVSFRCREFVGFWRYDQKGERLSEGGVRGEGLLRSKAALSMESA